MKFYFIYKQIIQYEFWLTHELSLSLSLPWYFKKYLGENINNNLIN